MIALDQVADRLEAGGVKRVLGVLEYLALQSTPAVLPAHFVTPLEEAAAPNRYGVGLAGSIVDQRVDFTFQVVTIVQAIAARAGRPSEDLRLEVEQVRAALIGWQVPGAAMPIEYVGGRLLSAGGREAVWSSRFRTAYHERTQVQ